jgi:hypothetical protein
VIGGDALQTCLAKGWIGYELNVFRAGEVPPPQTTPVR